MVDRLPAYTRLSLAHMWGTFVVVVASKLATLRTQKQNFSQMGAVSKFYFKLMFTYVLNIKLAGSLKEAKGTGFGNNKYRTE